MAVPTRTVSLPTIWADGAQTSIPVPPVKGIGYRNAALSASKVLAGQLYGSIGDSAAWNQYLWQMANVTQASESYGIPPYCPTTIYKERALTLYTDGLLYRAKQDVPVGTPPSNTTYWDKYVPDGVTVTPEVTATAGVTLYVDYSRGSSGDGTTMATAFRNFSECFNAIRGKYAAANGAFTGATPIYLFKIVATGPGSTVTIEAGAWRLQALNFEIEFQKNFTHPTGIFLTGCTCLFNGAGTLTINGPLKLDTTSLVIDCNINTRNQNGGTGVDVDLGRGMSARNSNVELRSGKTLSLLGVSGFQAAGGFFDINGTLQTQGTTGGNLLVMCDLAITGRATMDAANTSTPATVQQAFVQSSVRVNGGSLYIRGMSQIGGITHFDSGYLYVGSNFANAPAQGIWVRGGTLVWTSAVNVRAWTTAPTNKGIIDIGGSVSAPGLAAASWPGGGSMQLLANGYYAAS